MVKNIISLAVMAVLISVLVSGQPANSPVWEPLQENYDINEGATLIMTARATDADADPLRLTVDNFDINGQNASFIDNGDGTGTFTWTPDFDDARVYEISFGVTDQPEQEQPLVWNWTSTMITVHDVPPPPPEDNNNTSGNTTDTPEQPPVISAQEQEYNELRAEFNLVEDDYSLYKRRYERAIDEDNEEDIDEYEENLEDVDNDLAELEEDVENLIEDVEESDLPNRSQLLDNLDELLDDIVTIRERIDDLFNGDEQQSGTIMNNYVPPPPQVQPQEETGTRVIVEPLDFTGTSAEPQDTWQQTRKMVWIGAGVVVLIAVIVFLVALLVI